VFGNLTALMSNQHKPEHVDKIRFAQRASLRRRYVLPSRANFLYSDESYRYEQFFNTANHPKNLTNQVGLSDGRYQTGVMT
jgi:hypothetical protein